MAKIIGQHIPGQLRNLAVNEAFDFWQRSEGNTSTINQSATVTPSYTTDMFAVASQGSTNKNYSIQRSTDVPSQAQSGWESTYSYLFTMVTGIASPAATDLVIPCEYRMEGLDYEKIHNKTVTFGFWIKASIAGTYSFALGNSAGNRAYVTTFTVNGALTWQFVTLTIALDSAGTWNFDNTLGLAVYIASVSGSNFQTSSLNTWQAGTFVMASTATNWQATTGATLQIAQFSIVEGPLGFSATGFSRQGATYWNELSLCQRYYEKSYDIGTAPGTNTTSGMVTGAIYSTANWAYMQIFFKATKRIATSLNYWDAAGNSTKVSAISGGGNARTDNISASVNQSPGTQGNAFGWDNATGTQQSLAVQWSAEAGL